MKTVSMEDYEFASEENSGYCIVCKDWTEDACEPDARKYKCSLCWNMSVFGAEQALLEGYITISDDEMGDE